MRDQTPAPGNKYNQNFRNRFCGCREEYDAQQEKGTMFQCMGLASEEEGGCGEDWWHPECILGIGRDSKRRQDEGEDDGIEKLESEGEKGVDGNDNVVAKSKNTSSNTENHEDNDEEEEDPPLPPGFPAEDDFDSFICYKCLDVFPWLKRYAGTDGFLPAVERDTLDRTSDSKDGKVDGTAGASGAASSINFNDITKTGKRKASSLNEDDEVLDNEMNGSNQRIKLDTAAEGPQSTFKPDSGPKSKPAEKPDDGNNSNNNNQTTDDNSNIQNYKHCHYATLPKIPVSNSNSDSSNDTQTSPSLSLSLFLKPSFRDHFCRCPACFPRLSRHSVLLEEEDVYEPPLSEGEGEDSAGAGAGGLTLRTGNANGNDNRSIRTDDVHSTGTGTGSLLDRGEAALMTGMDRVKAIGTSFFFLFPSGTGIGLNDFLPFTL